MKISEILEQEMVISQVAGDTKETVLQALSNHMSQNTDELPVPAEAVCAALLNRERLGSTGVGEGVAIPHAKISGLSRLLACFGRHPKGVSFNAIDGQPVSLIFVLLVPDNSAGAHLKALARISRLLKQEAFRDRLLGEPDAPSLYQTFLDEDQKL